MSAAWVAASVRARAMARRRLGLVGIQRLREAGSLPGACGLLADTAYSRASGATDLAAAQRAVAGAFLWQIRILAGWMPSGGTPIARAVVAAFERENCCNHLRLVSGEAARGGARIPEPFHLGSLSTAWHRVLSTTTAAELRAELAASAWGDIPVDDQAGFRDAMAAAWLRRMSDDVPGARSLAESAAILLVCRAQLLEGRTPQQPAAGELDAVLGPDWSRATTTEELRAAVGAPAKRVLSGIDTVDQLWLAEVALWQQTADTGSRLLRTALPSPEVVVGAIEVLAADAFRVRAALADAAVGGTGEVLGGVA